LTTSDDISIRDNIASKFSKVKALSSKGRALNDSLVKKVPSSIPPCLLKLEKAKNCIKNAVGRRKDQATLSTSNILKIKEAFPTLPNRKILEIHKATFPKQNNKGKKV